MKVQVSKRALIARLRRLLHKDNKLLAHRRQKIDYIPLTPGNFFMVIDLTENTVEGTFSLSEILNNYGVIKDYEEAIL